MKFITSNYFIITIYHSMKFKTTAMACLMALSAQAQDGKTMKAYMVADAHLDTQWNWDVQSTIREHI